MYEDRAVAAVEGIFGVSRRYEADAGQRTEAKFALWVCACGGEEHDGGPTWLVFDRATDGRIAWCRVPARTEPLDLVRAKDTAGDHASPQRYFSGCNERM